MISPDDNRNFLRMIVDTEVQLRLADNTTLNGRCVNLSATGLAVVLAQSVEIGTEVHAEIHGSGGMVPALSVSAKVVRCAITEDNQYELGLETLSVG